MTLAARRGPVERTLGILELVAARGGATARELSVALGLPLPTVYRLAKELVDADYRVVGQPPGATASGPCEREESDDARVGHGGTAAPGTRRAPSCRTARSRSTYDRTAGMWIVGEDMPQESNRITLNTDVKDQHGLPVPNVHFDDHRNDVAMREHGYARADLLYEAVGALRVHHTPPYPSTHNLGTCRMSERPQDGVVDRWGRAHDVPNLFVSDGSVMTTGAAANPTLTIVALATRQADHIVAEMSARNL